MDDLGEIWPRLENEIWLASRLGNASLLSGVTNHALRRTRIRSAILDSGKALERVTNHPDRTETFAELFERMYGVPLVSEPAENKSQIELLRELHQ